MDTNEQEPGSTEQQSSRPAAKFSGTGGLHVAVWKNRTESGTEMYSVKLERNYKDSDGSFHTTQYLRDSDLLRAEKLLAQADYWIEHDKGRQRTQAGGQGRQ